MSFDTGIRVERGLTRREMLLRAGAAGGLLLAGGALLGHPLPVRAQQRGGNLRVAVAGGSLKDSIDRFGLTSNWIDIARIRQLYEPLANIDHDNSVYMELAESIEPNSDLS